MQELKINETFRDLIPPLADHEREGLEEDILHFGCQCPITTWNGYIIDGHHRYEICMRYKLSFKTEEREFEDEESVMIWMIDNQKGRRNITTAAKIRLAMKKIDIFKRRARKRQACGQGGVLLSADLRKGKDKCWTAEEMGKDAGVSTRVVEQFMYIEKHAPKELVNDLCEGKVVTDENGKKRRLTIDGVYNKTKTKKVREETIASLESIENQEVKAIKGLYDIVVLDPPWEIAQPGCCSDKAGYKPLPYPTMSVEEIKELEVPCADDCHVFLWATQRFLPDALEILKSWGMKYVCTLTWHKNAGMQPLGLPQYNAEHVLYARKGTPQFVDTKNFQICFNAPRGRHSEKPKEFYETICRTTLGRRLDMFNRRVINGFDGWGNEATA